MTKTEEIIQKYNEFNDYLASIDVKELRQNFSRTELTAFKEKLSDVGLRSLGYEIEKITEAMKKEEFPQLEGVYRYPILNEIDFLSDKQKVELDKYLGMMKLGNHVQSLWRITSNLGTQRLLEEWLQEKGIIEKRYQALCPNCSGDSISKFMKTSEKEKVEEALVQYKQAYSDENYAYLDKMLQLGCFSCDEYSEFEDIDFLPFNEVYQLIMERDTTLDKA